MLSLENDCWVMAQASGSLHALRSSVRLTKLFVGFPPHRKVFETELRFILREPRSKIARAVTQPANDAPISFDRSPKHFPAILEYLSRPTARAWAQDFPDEAGLLEFLDEAEFYGLEALAAEIQGRLYEIRRINVYVGIGRDYVTIGAAIAACSQGQRIMVEPGTYEERLDITKDVSIIALDSAAGLALSARGNRDQKSSAGGVIIQFASNSVITISSNVSVENLTIRRILRTGFDRKNVVVDLKEETVTRDSTTEFAGAAIRVVKGGSLKLQRCCVMSQSDSMLSIDPGCRANAHHCAFSKACGHGITCRGHLSMHSCQVSHATDSALVVELGFIEMQHCSLTSSVATSCLISRNSSVSCAHCTFSGCSGPCVRLECVGALTADVFDALVAEHAAASKSANETASLSQNGCDPAVLSLLLAKFQGLATAAPARLVDMQSMSLKQLKQLLLIGESLFNNCVVKDCNSVGIVCCGGSVRLIEVALQSCKHLAVLAQDRTKLSISSCRISDCSGCALWARSQAAVLAVSLQLEDSHVSGLVVDGCAMVKLIDSSIISSGRSAVSIVNGGVYMRGVALARNKRCGVETCSEESSALLLAAHNDALNMFKPISLKDTVAPPALLLELQSCSITANGDGVVVESKRKIFASEPIFSRVQFVGNVGSGCALLSALCNPVFRDCEFRDNASFGAHFELSGRGTLNSCAFEGNGRCAVHVQGQGSFCCLRDCNISNHAVAGIVFEECAGADVKDCRLVGNHVAAIALSSAAPIMTRCQFSACPGTALVCGRSSAGKYESCTFSDNKGLSVSIEGSARPFLQSCSFSPAADVVNAVTCCSGSEGNISNCVFDSVGSVALVLQRDSNVRIANCSIKGCTQFGMLCMAGAKGSLE